MSSHNVLCNQMRKTKTNSTGGLPFRPYADVDECELAPQSSRWKKYLMYINN